MPVVIQGIWGTRGFASISITALIRFDAWEKYELSYKLLRILRILRNNRFGVNNFRFYFRLPSDQLPQITKKSQKRDIQYPVSCYKLPMTQKRECIEFNIYFFPPLNHTRCIHSYWWVSDCINLITIEILMNVKSFSPPFSTLMDIPKMPCKSIRERSRITYKNLYQNIPECTGKMYSKQQLSEKMGKKSSPYLVVD